jgi:hypothetical protein
MGSPQADSLREKGSPPCSFWAAVSTPTRWEAGAHDNQQELRLRSNWGCLDEAVLQAEV